MKLYDKVLKTKLHTDTTDKYIGTHFQPSYDKPTTKHSAPVTLNATTDGQGLDRAYARDNGIYDRNTTM
jgi:hypothetical protein